MTYVRTFEGFAPPPRYEAAADPFTEVSIEEAAANTGPFAVIETIALAPPDEDPASPRLRNFTTDEATLDPAWYRLTWKDAGGQTFEAEPIYFPEVPAWTPSVADVAAHIRARTKDSAGNEVGTFDSTTRPTGREVERLITKAVRRVQTAVGEPCNAALEADAGAAAAIYAAMLIEQSYFPEQTAPGGSSFNSLYSLWKDQIRTLDEEIARTCGGVGPEPGGGAGLRPAAYTDVREMIGPNSKDL